MKMIFFCFSSKDRHSIVEAVLFHITNFELPVWYDRYKMLLGDNRNYKNFDEGINNANYSVIILSPNTLASVCANEEIELIYQRYQEQKIIVFPLLYKLTVHDLPESFVWIKHLVYKEVTDEVDVHSACNHIICRILLDELSRYKYQSFDIFCESYKNIPAQSFPVEILNKYRSIDKENYNARITLLYTVYIFIKSTYNISDIPTHFYAGMDRLFDETRLNLDIDLREILIFERLTLLLLNAILFGYII